MRRDLSDDAVVHPIRGCIKGDAVGAVEHGPDFCDGDPCAGTSEVAEVGYEEPDHSNCRVCKLLIRLEI